MLFGDDSLIKISRKANLVVALAPFNLVMSLFALNLELIYAISPEHVAGSVPNLKDQEDRPNGSLPGTEDMNEGNRTLISLI